MYILKICSLILCINTLIGCSNTVSRTTRPIIGILAQEYPLQKYFPDIKAKSYIAASYVKAIESSGARVVPILIGKSKSYYRWIMKVLNGILIPGGSAPLKPGNGYYDAATQIYKNAIELNKNGTYFPILGVCLGFEALLAIANNHDDPRVECQVDFDNFPLKFESVAENSLLYSNIPHDIEIYLKYLPITVNHHKYCITPKDLNKTNLRKEWRITTTNQNSYGFKFISSVEHKTFPIIGIQFHPEKASFEWKEQFNFPHSEHAILANRYFYDFLVHLSKQNGNGFQTKKSEEASLIYNYSPIYSEAKWSFEQIYAF